MFPGVRDIGGFPSFFKSAIFDPSFDGVIILKVTLILNNSLENFFFGDRIADRIVLDDSSQVDHKTWDEPAVSKNVIMNIFIRFEFDELYTFVSKIAFCIKSL